MAVYEDVDGGDSLMGVAGRYTQIAGAAVSLTLMISVGVWGTRTILRDVSGVPVVRAMQGEMRVAPENPGGDVAEHRGLAVNTVAAVGEAAPPEDTLTLAPRTMDLAAEDLESQPLTDATSGPDAEVLTTVTADAGAVPPVPTGPMNADDILALADQIAAGVAPLSQVEDEEGGNPVMSVDGEEVTGEEIANIDDQDPIALALAEAMASDLPVPAATVAAPAGALRKALRPTARPAAKAPTAAATTVAATVAADPVAADPAAAVVIPAVADAAPVLPSEAILTADLPVGTKLVQLGAFPTAADAATEWGRLTSQFGDVMGDKAQVIQEASSGGATFYRLRASGFDDLDAARQFCATLDAARAACIPVVVR